MNMKTIMHNMQKRSFAIIYSATAVILVLAALAQMPLAKRYYLADIPGLAWTGNFLTSYHVFYIAAVLMTVLISYRAADFLLQKDRDMQLSTAGIIKAASLAGLLISGFMKIAMNASDVYFSQEYLVFINFTYIIFTMLFMLSTLVFIGSPYKWVKSKA